MKLTLKRCWPLLVVALFVGWRLVLAQSSAETTPSPTPPSALAQVDTLVKIVAGLITGLVALVGLPIVFLTYKKTRAEITKLELEAKALQEKQSTNTIPTSVDEGNIRIVLDHSPESTIQVLADPRFLAPLLILLDFIFAWIALTLVGYLLSVLDLGLFRTVVLTILSLLLLFPIARQVLRVRAVLQPPRTAKEIHASQQQVRIVAWVIYVTAALSCIGFGAIMLIFFINLTNFGRYMAWGLMILGVLFIAASPIASRWLNQYLVRLYQRDSHVIVNGANSRIDV